MPAPNWAWRRVVVKDKPTPPEPHRKNTLLTFSPRRAKDKAAKQHFIPKEFPQKVRS
jgi:hypothetical protein